MRTIDASVWDELCAQVVDGAALRRSIDKILADPAVLDIDEEEDLTPGDLLIHAINVADGACFWLLDWKSPSADLVHLVRAAVSHARGANAVAALDLAAVPLGRIVADGVTASALVDPLAALGLELCQVDQGFDGYATLVVPTDRAAHAERLVAALGADVRLRPLPEGRVWDLPEVPAETPRSGSVTRAGSRSVWAVVGSVAFLVFVTVRALPLPWRYKDTGIDDTGIDTVAITLWTVAACLVVVWLLSFAQAVRVRRRRRALAQANPGSFVGTTVMTAALRNALAAVAASHAPQDAAAWTWSGRPYELEYAVTPRGLVLDGRGTRPDLCVPRSVVRSAAPGRVALENRYAWSVVLACVVDGREVELPLAGRWDMPLPLPDGLRATRAVAAEICVHWPEVLGGDVPGLVRG